MDPYLEDPQIWPGVHAAFIVYLRDSLQPMLRPRYIAAVEERVYVEGPDREIIPDVWIKHGSRGGKVSTAVAEPDEALHVRVPALEVHESYIAILDRQSGQQVVTVIEVVSPANKYAGPGRVSYLAKQDEVRRSQTHLVEIDLLRTGPHVLAVPEWAARGKGQYDYLISINRAQGLRGDYDLHLCQLRNRLPKIRVPLAGDDPDVVLNLQAVLDQVHEAGSYRQRLHYEAPCLPPLSAEDQAWASAQIAAAIQE